MDGLEKELNELVADLTAGRAVRQAELTRLAVICSGNTRLADSVIARLGQDHQATPHPQRQHLEGIIKWLLLARGPSEEEKASAPKLRAAFPTALPLRQNITCPACGLPYSLSLPAQLNGWLEGRTGIGEVPIQCNNAGCGAITTWTVPNE